MKPYLLTHLSLFYLLFLSTAAARYLQSQDYSRLLARRYVEELIARSPLHSDAQTVDPPKSSNRRPDRRAALGSHPVELQPLAALKKVTTALDSPASRPASSSESAQHMNDADKRILEKPLPPLPPPSPDALGIHYELPKPLPLPVLPDLRKHDPTISLPYLNSETQPTSNTEARHRKRSHVRRTAPLRLRQRSRSNLRRRR